MYYLDEHELISPRWGGTPQSMSKLNLSQKGAADRQNVLSSVDSLYCIVQESKDRWGRAGA